MADTTPSLPPAALLDDVVGNASGNTRRQTIDHLATQIAAKPAFDIVRDHDTRIDTLEDRVTVIEENIASYATLAAGIAAVADGARFIRLPSVGNWGMLFVRQGTKARFLQWVPINPAGRTEAIRLAALRSRPSRPDYDWDFSIVFDGRFVPNVGTMGDASPDPYPQLLADTSLMFDKDGGTASTREVWPVGVPNALGLDECMRLTVTATTQIHFYGYPLAYPDLPAGDYVQVVEVRQTSGTSPIKIGSSSDINGTVLTVTPGTSTTRYEVDQAAWSGASTFSLCVRPGNGGSTPVPYVLVFERIAIYLKDSVIPTLADWRADRIAGHARAMFAAGGAINDADDAFRPDRKCGALVSDTAQAPVWDTLHYKFYARLPDLGPGNWPLTAYSAVSIVREANPGTNFASYAGAAYQVQNTPTEYYGRPFLSGCGQVNIGAQEAPDTCLAGFGWHRVDLVYGGNSADCAFLPNQQSVNRRRYMQYIDGVLHTDVPEDKFPAGLRSKVWVIGGNRANSTAWPQHDNSSFPGSIRKPALHVNKPFPTAEAIIADMQADMAENPLILEKVVFAKTNEGDSTSKFPGAPSHWWAYQMRGTGRLFINASAGGSFQHSAGLPVPLNVNAFNHPARIAARKRNLQTLTQVLKVPLIIAQCHCGENNNTHLANAAQAYADYETMFVANEVALYSTALTRIVPVIVTVRPSGNGGPSGASNLNKAGFNTLLRSKFPTATPVPYLFKRAPGDTTTLFEYMIDLDAWAPRRGTETYSNWFECLERAVTVSYANVAAAQAAGAAIPPHLGVIRITDPNPDEFYRYAGTSDPGSGTRFSVTYNNATTHWYVLKAGQVITGNSVIGGDLQHWVSDGGIDAAGDVFVPSDVQIAADFGLTLTLA